MAFLSAISSNIFQHFLRNIMNHCALVVVIFMNIYILKEIFFNMYLNKVHGKVQICAIS